MSESCSWKSGHKPKSFIHLAVCLTTGPKPLPKPALHIVQSRASSFKWEYPLLSLRSSSSFLRLLPRLPVTSIPPFIFPSLTRCRRQFLRKMWPIQLAFRLLISLTFMKISPIILVRMRNVSGKICRENQNKDEPRTVQSAQQLAVGLDDQSLVARTPSRALRFEAHSACGYWEFFQRGVWRWPHTSI